MVWPGFDFNFCAVFADNTFNYGEPHPYPHSASTEKRVKYELHIGIT